LRTHETNTVSQEHTKTRTPRPEKRYMDIEQTNLDDVVHGNVVKRKQLLDSVDDEEPLT